jgi:hypothetical protein
MFSDFSGEAAEDESYFLRKTPKHRKRIKFNESVEVYRYEGTRAHFDTDNEEEESPESAQTDILNKESDV